MVKKKKGYNPLKMWGSWIGLIFYVLTLLIISRLNFNQGFTRILARIILFPSGLFNWSMNETTEFIPSSLIIAMLVIQPIFWFLVGYGIHSLCRAIKQSGGFDFDFK